MDPSDAMLLGGVTTSSQGETDDALDNSEGDADGNLGDSTGVEEVDEALQQEEDSALMQEDAQNLDGESALGQDLESGSAAGVMDGDELEREDGNIDGIEQGLSEDQTLRQHDTQNLDGQDGLEQLGDSEAASAGVGEDGNLEREALDQSQFETDDQSVMQEDAALTQDDAALTQEDAALVQGDAALTQGDAQYLGDESNLESLNGDLLNQEENLLDDGQFLKGGEAVGESDAAIADEAELRKGQSHGRVSISYLQTQRKKREKEKKKEKEQRVH